MNSSEHFYQKSCDASAIKAGEYSDDCFQNKDPSKNLNSNLDFQIDDSLHKKIQPCLQDQANNFAIPSIRKSFQQSQGTFYQFQSPYQQLPSHQGDQHHHHHNHHQHHLASLPAQLQTQQWTQSCVSSHPSSNSFQHQPPMSYLDNRFSAVKSNKFPDTPPDSGSEPYSPPNNANAINSNNGFVDLSCQKNSSSSSTIINPPSINNIRNIHPGSSYYLRGPQYMPPKHFSCSFTRPPAFPMYPHVEFPKVDYFGREDAGHLYASQQPNKKRKYQDSPQGSLGQLSHGVSLPIKHEPCPSDLHYAGLQHDGGGSEDEFNCEYSCDGAMFQDGSYRVITWSPHQQNKWASLVDETGREVVILNYRVDADKGFNFALPDESFVCQKKNHFQITVHINVSLKPKFAKSPDSNDNLETIEAFHLHFYGIKAESPNQTIKIEQSQSDRSKKVFNPVPIDLVVEEMNKVTVGRLHFSETTLNNMRKKGKPNPDQRYFQLVVSLEAHCTNNNVYTVAAHVSDKIIVRASNPGQFENDVDVVWNKGKASDVIYHAGRVGINTDNPDEALTVHGNVRVTGHVMAPSDMRIKMKLQELDTGEQLRNISQMNVYKFHFSEEFADYAGLSDEEKIGAGVLAQEVYRVLPDAVRETGDVVLTNGQIIEKFLLVNKERIFMENVGAVKELCKVTDKLEDRINEMESMKKKLANYCRNKLGSTWSSSSQSSVSIVSGSFNSDKKSTGSSNPSKSYQQRKHRLQKDFKRGDELSSPLNSNPPSPSLSAARNLWSSHAMQIVIISLIIVMAACLISITTLYVIDRQSSTQQTQQMFMSLQSISNRSNSQKTLPPMSSNPRYLVPPICLENRKECPVVCCEMPPNNPSDRFGNFPTSTSLPRPWWVDYLPSTKTWKKPHNKLNDVPLIYVKPKKPASNKTKPKPEKNNYLKYVLKQHEKKHSRLKRDVEGATMVQINVPQLNSTLSQDFCSSKDCKDMKGSNFSFNIPLSSRYPLAFITLQFMPSASEDDMNVEFCSEAKLRSCEEHRDESIYSTKGAGLFSWDLPVGFFFNSRYNFRVSHVDVENPCTVPNSSLGKTFTTYNFNFYRMCDK